MGEFLGLIGAALAVAGLVWAFRSSRAWHLMCIVAIALAKLHAIALIGVGGGLLTCGISGLAVGEIFEMGSPSILVGTGVGLLTGGILLLWITIKARIPQLVPPSEPVQRQPELPHVSATDRDEDETAPGLESVTAKLASA